MYSGVLEASGKDVAEWLMSPIFEERLFSYFPCADTIPGMANKVRAVANTLFLSFDLENWSTIELIIWSSQP